MSKRNNKWCKKCLYVKWWSMAKHKVTIYDRKNDDTDATNIYYKGVIFIAPITVLFTVKQIVHAIMIPH